MIHRGFWSHFTLLNVPALLLIYTLDAWPVSPLFASIHTHTHTLSLSLLAHHLLTTSPSLQHRDNRANLLLDTLPTRPTHTRARLDTAFIVEALQHIVGKPGIHPPQLLLAQLVHRHALLLRERHHPPADVVGLAEWHALADQIIGQVGGQHVGRERGTHPVREDGHGAQHPGGDLDAVAHRLGA